MSTITLQDPLDALLTEATNGTSLLKDRNTLHFTHIPTLIHHRDIEQKSVATKCGLGTIRKYFAYLLYCII